MSLYRFVGAFVLLWMIAGKSPAQTQAQKPVATPAAQKPAVAADEQIPPALPGALFPALVGRVNGKPILGRDLDRLVKTELSTIGSPSWASLREEYRQELTSKHLGALIVTEMMHQKAVADGMKVTEAEVQAELARIAKAYPSDAALNQALAKQGMDRAGLLKELERTLLVNKFIQENAAKKVAVTPADLTGYYSSHTEDFRHPDIVRTSHILIAVKDGASEQEDKAARQKAEEILARIKKGEDFARLAKENSADPSAPQGGDIGWVASGDTAPEYEQAAFALKVGEVSDVVRTQFGYHILKVTSKKNAGIDTLDDVRADLTELLKREKTQAEVGKIVEGLRAQAKVEVFLPPGSLPPSTAGSTPPGR